MENHNIIAISWHMSAWCSLRSSWKYFVNAIAFSYARTQWISDNFPFLLSYNDRNNTYHISDKFHYDTFGKKGLHLLCRSRTLHGKVSVSSSFQETDTSITFSVPTIQLHRPGHQFHHIKLHIITFQNLPQITLFDYIVSVLYST